jgi:hypothetical protein
LLPSSNLLRDVIIEGFFLIFIVVRAILLISGDGPGFKLITAF